MVLTVKQRFQIDDSLDVFAVHGVGGMLGSITFPFLVLPLFGGPGFADGNDLISQLFAQIFAVGIVAVYTGLVTWLIGFMISYAIPMRVSEEAEHDGLDVTSHGERGWEFE
jgi:Amt family ammonium transporter